MTPGIPSGSDVPDDAGIQGSDASRSRLLVLLWAGFVVLGVTVAVLFTGTVGASVVTTDADLGSPSVVVELDATPTVALVAGDVAVGVAVTADDVHILFGVTDAEVLRQL